MDCWRTRISSDGIYLLECPLDDQEREFALIRNDWEDSQLRSSSSGCPWSVKMSSEPGEMDWQAGWDGGWMKKASLGAVKVSFVIQNVITIDNHHHLIRFWSPPWPNIFIFFQALNQQSMGILIFKLLWHSITGWWGRLRWELTGTSASTLHLKRRKSIGRSNRWKEWNPESTKEWRMFQGKFAKLSLSLNTWVEKREILVFLMGGFSVIFANPARCLFVSMPFIISFSIFIYVFVVTFYPKINHLFPQQKNSCSMILTFSSPFPPVAWKVHDAAINIWEMMMGGTFRRAVRAPKKDPWDEGLNWWCQIEGWRILLRICLAKSKGWWCQDLTVTSQGFPAVNMPRKWVSVFLDNSNVPCIFIDELRIRTCWESLT